MSDELKGRGVDAAFEPFKLSYVEPEKVRLYTPDFVLPNDIVVETKGRFVTADRQKHKHIKKAHPDLDVRFVFSNPNTKIGKTSKTTYAMWCEGFGFAYAAKSVPTAWINEPANPSRSAALIKARKA